MTLTSPKKAAVPRAGSRAAQRQASLQRPRTDLRGLLPPDVPTQGPRPLCLPFSVGAAHEAARCRSFGTSPEALGVESLWSHSLQNGSAGPDGTDLDSTADSLETVGQVTAAAWPYDPTLADGTEAPPSTVGPPPWWTAAVNELSLRHDGIEDDLEDALAASHVVILVVEVTDEFDNPDANGDIDVPPLTAPVGDYHAVAVVGAATSVTGSARRLLIRNTWGVLWGASGYGWLPVDYLVAFAVQAASIDSTSLTGGATP